MLNEYMSEELLSIIWAQGTNLVFIAIIAAILHAVNHVNNTLRVKG